MLIVSILGVIILGGGLLYSASSFFGISASNPNQPLSTASYPHVASAYQGTAHNVKAGATTALVLTSIVQKQQDISGKVFWDPGFIGDGSFTGSIGTNRSVHFTDKTTGRSITFNGSLSSNGSFGGTYTISSNGQTGTWQTKPYQPHSNPHVVSAYQGKIQNLTLGRTTTLVLTSIVQKQQNISGKVIIGPGLHGNGSFTGSIEADGSVHFTDKDTTDGLTTVFTGLLSPNGSLSGSYIIPSSGQNGIWQAAHV